VAGDEERELARFTLTGGVPTTGMVMATMVRDGDQWRLRAVGQGIAAKIPTESVDALRAFV
jgi:stress response protein SCP2